MAEERQVDFSAARSAAVQEARQGNNIMFLDRHSNPDHLALLSSPQFLEETQQAARQGGRGMSVLLEMHPDAAQSLRELQRSGMSESELQNAIRERGLYTSHAEEHGRSEQSIQQTASLVYHTGRLGIPIMAHDLEINEESMRLGGLNRVSPDALTASAGDQQIARDASAEAGNNVIVGAYGRDHFLSFNDLDERLTHETGRPTRVFGLDERGDPQTSTLEINSLRHAQTQYNGHIDPPDYIYRDGEARRTNPDILTNDRCVDPGRWITDDCSTRVREPAQRLRRAGLDNMQDVPVAQLGELSPAQTPGMERSREVGLA